MKKGARSLKSSKLLWWFLEFKFDLHFQKGKKSFDVLFRVKRNNTGLLKAYASFARLVEISFFERKKEGMILVVWLWPVVIRGLRNLARLNGKRWTFPQLVKKNLELKKGEGVGLYVATEVPERVFKEYSKQKSYTTIPLFSLIFTERCAEIDLSAKLNFYFHLFLNSRFRRTGQTTLQRFTKFFWIVI